MSDTLKGLMDELNKKQEARDDEIFTISLLLLTLMKNAEMDTTAFGGTMAAYFCPDVAMRTTWLKRIAAVCEEEMVKVPLTGEQKADDDILSASEISFDTMD